MTVTTIRRPNHAGTDTMDTMVSASRFIIAGLAIGAACSISSAALGAQTPKVYYACYVPSSGTVYRIREPGTPTACGTTSKKGQQTQHIEFSWTDGAGALRVTDAAGGDLSGALGSPAVAKLLGRALSATPPTDGQVLTWNATGNTWEPRPAAGGGTSDHGALVGLGDDDHPQYLLADGVRSSQIGFAVTGIPEGAANVAPVSGPGARMMWVPARGAFRAGAVSGPGWNATNIGLFSTALGHDAIAEGHSAVSLGAESVANGVSSFAVQRGRALGTYSIAMGEEALATGGFSAAIGTHVTAGGQFSMALGRFASTSGRTGAVVIGDASQTTPVEALTDNHFVVRAGRFWFGNDNNVTATVGRFMETSTGAFLSSGGTWTNSSDSTRKTAFHEVNGDSVLSRLATMPIRTWRYRDEDSTVRHMGPTAQDFRTAFALGDSDRAIATVDADGVSLAGIQALIARTDRLTRDTEELARTNAELRAHLGALENRLASLESALAEVAAQRSSGTSQR